MSFICIGTAHCACAKQHAPTVSPGFLPLRVGYLPLTLLRDTIVRRHPKLFSTIFYSIVSTSFCCIYEASEAGQVLPLVKSDIAG